MVVYETNREENNVIISNFWESSFCKKKKKNTHKSLLLPILRVVNFACHKKIEKKKPGESILDSKWDEFFYLKLHSRLHSSDEWKVLKNTHSWNLHLTARKGGAVGLVIEINHFFHLALAYIFAKLKILDCVKVISSFIFCTSSFYSFMVWNLKTLRWAKKKFSC